MWNKIRQYFKKLINPPNEEIRIPRKTLEFLEVLDDVWIKQGDDIRRAWVWEINKRTITVAYYDSPEIIKIHYQRPLNVETIKDGNIIMYLNYAHI